MNESMKAVTLPVLKRTQRGLLTLLVLGSYLVAGHAFAGADPRSELNAYAHIGGDANVAASPGTQVSTTYWDMQHYGSIGRMIGWGTHGSPQHMLVQFTWTRQVTAEASPEARYSCYDAGSTWAVGDPAHSVTVSSPAAFTNLAVDNLDRAWVAYSPLTGSDWDWGLSRDASPGSTTFTSSGGGGEEAWPRVQVQMQGADTVVHVLVRQEGTSLMSSGPLIYCRKSGLTWTSTVLGTVLGYAYDLAASRTTGKIAAVWTDGSYLLYPAKSIRGDLKCRISNDKGLTWGPVTNITNNPAIGLRREPGHDVSALIDASNHLHVVWAGRGFETKPWPIFPTTRDYGRIFHWSDASLVISTVHSANFAQRFCDGGKFNYNATKPTISQCDGKLYVVFVKFNNNATGIYDDCASSTATFVSGGANGELYVDVSSNDGLSWDKARNLTNTYTPDCDSATGMGGICYSDNWPSVVPFGTDFAGSFTGITKVDPSGSYAGAWYLDVQYIEDRYPGAWPLGEGIATSSPLKWFRLACVGPTVTQVPPVIWPPKFEFPTTTQHGVQLDTSLSIENISVSSLPYTISVTQYNGPAGWLTFSGFDGMLSTGASATDVGTVRFNNGGVVAAPGTVVGLRGAIRIVTAVSDDTIPVEVLVADFVQSQMTDTAAASGLSLAVSNNGSFGNRGNCGLGGLNMDFLAHGETDTTARVYLREGSPFLGMVVGPDTIVYTSFGAYNGLEDYPSPGGKVGRLIPTESLKVSVMGGYNKIETGKIVSEDSLVGMDITWYAPTAAANTKFIIQRMRVYPNKRIPLTNLMVGNIVDWDIPSDSGEVNNVGGFDVGRNMAYQRGTGAGSSRYGGVSIIGVTKIDGAVHMGLSFWGMHVYPANDLFQNDSIAMPGALYAMNYNSPGFDYADGSSDMCTSACVAKSASLDTTFDTLQVVTGFTSTRSGGLGDLQLGADQAKAWVDTNLSTSCCSGIRGNADSDPGDGVDIADLQVFIDYLFFNGSAAVCTEEFDTSGNDGLIDISDLQVLLDYLFFGGTIAPCP